MKKIGHDVASFVTRPGDPLGLRPRAEVAPAVPVAGPVVGPVARGPHLAPAPAPEPAPAPAPAAAVFFRALYEVVHSYDFPLAGQAVLDGDELFLSATAANGREVAEQLAMVREGDLVQLGDGLRYRILLLGGNYPGVLAMVLADIPAWPDDVVEVSIYLGNGGAS